MNALARTTTAVTMFNAGVKVTASGSSHVPFPRCLPTPLQPLALSPGSSFLLWLESE